MLILTKLNHGARRNSIVVEKFREGERILCVDESDGRLSVAGRSSGSSVHDVRASFPESPHPRQQRRQLLLRQHCSDKLIAGEDHRLSVDDRRTFVRVGRQLPDDLEGVLVDPELEFARDRAPERRPLLQDEITDLQFGVCIAYILAVCLV